MDDIDVWPASLPRRQDGDRAWPGQASLWLAEVAPAYLADDPDVRDDPRLLCSLTRHHVAGQLQGCRETWRRLKAETAESGVLPNVAERILAAAAEEGQRLARLEQELAAIRVELAQAAWAAVPYKKRSGGR